MPRELRLCTIDRLEVRAAPDGRRQIVGHAAVFDRPSRPVGGRFDEVVKPGAFARALRERQDVRALVNHDPDRVLGRTKSGTLALAEDAQGLSVTIDPPDTQYARDLMALIERRDVDEMSFAFVARREKWLRAGGAGGLDRRELHDVDLFDVSPVTFAQYPQTDLAVRAHEEVAAELRSAPAVERVREPAAAEPVPAPELASDLGPGESRSCFDAHLGPWLMEPTRLAAGLALVQSGAWKPDARAIARSEIEARDDAPAVERREDANPRGSTPDERRGYSVVDGVAVIPVVGVMGKRASKYVEASTARTRVALRGALRDPDVRGVLLHVESPGGSAAGTAELGADVAAAEKVKPTHAFIADLGASAAYWVASQAGRVTSNPLAEVGSIGVYSVVIDESDRYRKAGLKVHVVASGPDKGLGVAGQEASPRLLALVDEHVRRLHDGFRAAVSGGRGLAGPKLDAVATGRTWGAAQAMELGLLDGVGTFEEALEGVRRVAGVGASRESRPAPAPAAAPAAAAPTPEARGAAAPPSAPVPSIDSRRRRLALAAADVGLRLPART